MQTLAAIRNLVATDALAHVRERGTEQLARRCVLGMTLLATSCLPNTPNPADDVSIDRRVPAQDVRIFTVPPRCPYINLGVLPGIVSPAGTEVNLRAMQEAASQRGGDGLLFSAAVTAQLRGRGDAVVIRFQSADCTD